LLCCEGKDISYQVSYTYVLNGLEFRWLIATLGYIQTSSMDLQLQVSLWRSVVMLAAFIDETNYGNYEQNLDFTTKLGGQTKDIIEDKIAQVTAVAANLIEIAASDKILLPSNLQEATVGLQNWHETVPSQLQLEILVTESCRLADQERRAAIYMHLFTQSIIVLKGRIVHANYYTIPNLFRYPDLRAAVVDGLSAARSTAQILEFLMLHRMIFRKSWLCM
jgi:hypothetical protein